MTDQDQESPRSMLRRWVREQVDGQDEIYIPKLAESAITYFSTDGEFIRALLTESLPGMVAEVCRAVFKSTRFIGLGDEFITREILEGRARSRWDVWMEHAGDRHIALTSMTKVDLLAAADERAARGDEEHRRAKFLRSLARPLKDGQTVGQAFTAEQLEQKRQAIWPKPKTKADAA